MQNGNLSVQVLGQDAQAIHDMARYGAVVETAGENRVILRIEGPEARPEGTGGTSAEIRPTLIVARSPGWALETLRAELAGRKDVPAAVLVPRPEAEFVDAVLAQGGLAAGDLCRADAGYVRHLLRRLLHRQSRRELRRRAFLRLRATSTSLKSVIDNNADAIVIVSHGGIVRFVNTAAEALFGRPAAEWVGKPFGYPLQRGASAEIELPHARGGTMAAEMRVVETQWAGENVFVASLRDITERRRAEQARLTLAQEQAARAEAEAAQHRSHFLAEASRVLGSSLDYATTLHRIARLAVPILADACIVDLADRDRLETVAVVHIDPEMSSALRQARDKLALSPAHRQGIAAVVRTGVTDCVPQVTDEDLQRWSHDPEHLEELRHIGIRGYISAALAARERTIGVITLLSLSPDRVYGPKDVALAEELAKRAALAVDNARLFHEARQANAAKDRFLAVLSHELRTPLTPVMLSLAALDDSPLSEEAHSQIELIRRNIELETRLIDDILDLTRIVQGKMRLHLKSLDLRGVLRSAMEISMPLIQGKRLRVQVRVPERPVMVWGDEARLQQAVWNVLSNAVKFTPDNGLVEAALEVKEKHADLLVRDTGIGIGHENLARVFNAFEQVERRVLDSHGGLGLGLTIAKAIMDLHKGEIHVESGGAGRGTTVRLSVPLPAEGVEPSLPGKSAAPMLARHPARILLVEDHPDTRTLMTRLLAGYGHDVTAVGTCAEARTRMTNGKSFDLLVSDISLPDGSGLELMPEFSRRHAPRGIAVSGFGMEHDLRRSSDAGFGVHLTKPVDLTELLRSIDRAMEQPSATAN